MGIIDLLVFITMYLRAADNKHLEVPCLNIFAHDRNEKNSLSTIKTIKKVLPMKPQFKNFRFSTGNQKEEDLYNY
jgi:hypothetical protein